MKGASRSLLASVSAILHSTEDGHFALEMLWNVARFLAIGVGAVVLQLIVHWIEGIAGDGFIVEALKIVEYCVLLADLMWFLARLFVGAYAVVLRMRRDLLEAKARIVARPVQQPTERVNSSHQ